jgi:hypothetical protein
MVFLRKIKISDYSRAGRNKAITYEYRSRTAVMRVKAVFETEKCTKNTHNFLFSQKTNLKNTKLKPTTMTVPTTTTTTHNTQSFYFEESYVDAMEGRRSLRDVMRQIDGLGPNRRYPKRRSEVVSLMDGETNGKKRPLFVNEQTPLAPNARLNMLHVWKDAELPKRVDGPSFPASDQLRVSMAIINDAIDIVQGL